MNPTLIICAIVAAVSFGSAWKIQWWRFDAERLEVQQQAEKRKQENEAAADKASAGAESDRAKLNEKFKTITVEVEKIVDRPVYRDGVCFDADGVRALNIAIGAKPATSKP